MAIIVNGADYEVPVKSDGELFTFELVTFGAQQRIYADAAPELLEFLIPQYSSSAPLSEQLTAILRHAFMVQTHLQSHINLASPHLLDALAPREKAFLENPNSNNYVLPSWRNSLPLVLVDAAYQPYTNIPRPVSESDDSLLWLTPAQGAYDYLVSLDEVGYITLACIKGGNV